MLKYACKLHQWIAGHPSDLKMLCRPVKITPTCVFGAFEVCRKFWFFHIWSISSLFCFTKGLALHAILLLCLRSTCWYAKHAHFLAKIGRKTHFCDYVESLHYVGRHESYPSYLLKKEKMNNLSNEETFSILH